MGLPEQIYYKLTANWQRKLPTSIDELFELKLILQTYYGLGNSFEEWVTVLGHIQGTRGDSLTNSYANLVNPAKRLKVNKMVQDEKILSIQENQKILEKKLKEKLEQLADEAGPGASTTNSDMPERAPDLQRVMPAVPEAEIQLVPGTQN